MISISALSRTASLTRTRRATRRRPGQVHAHVRRHPRRDGGHRPRRRRATTPRAPRRHSAPAFLFHSHLSSVFNRCPQWVYRGPMAHSLGIPIPSRPRRHSATPVSVPFMILRANYPSALQIPSSIHNINRSIVSIDPSYCSAIEPPCCSSIDASYCSSIDPSYCSPFDSSYCHSIQSGPFECLRLEPL